MEDSRDAGRRLATQLAGDGLRGVLVFGQGVAINGSAMLEGMTETFGPDVVISGGLALPPGPLGVLPLVPDLIAIWQIQSQLVADIAGARGRSGTLTREQMMYCLFRHAASQMLRDVVVRTGQRAVVHRLTLSTVQAIATQLGIQVSQQLIAKTASRWIPGLGAAAVAAYAWWDTERVARAADALFSREIEVDALPILPVEETARGRALRTAGSQ